MSRRSECLDAKVYVGGLPEDARSDEIETVFQRYGRIRKVWVARRPPGFAFVEFIDPRDAEDSVRGLDGTRICGKRARVELSHGRSRHSDRAPPARRESRSRSRSPYRSRSRTLSPCRSRSRTLSPQPSASHGRSLSRSPIPELTSSSPVNSVERDPTDHCSNSGSRSPSPL